VAHAARHVARQEEEGGRACARSPRKERNGRVPLRQPPRANATRASRHTNLRHLGLGPLEQRERLALGLAEVNEDVRSETRPAGERETGRPRAGDAGDERCSRGAAAAARAGGAAGRWGAGDAAATAVVGGGGHSRAVRAMRNNATSSSRFRRDEIEIAAPPLDGDHDVVAMPRDETANRDATRDDSRRDGGPRRDTR
jgi:hypothetical protein